MNSSLPYRASPEEVYIRKQEKRPRHYALAILNLPANERPAALALVPEELREWVKEIVEDTLWKQRWRKKREGVKA